MLLFLQGWRFYAGLGGEEGQVEKTRHRVVEMKTALRVLRALNKGKLRLVQDFKLCSATWLEDGVLTVCHCVSGQ